MKEATGEANITVITIVLIAVVLAVGTIIVRSLMSNTQKSSCCTSIGGVWKAGRCTVDCGKDENPKSGATSGCREIVASTGGVYGPAYKACLEEK